MRFLAATIYVLLNFARVWLRSRLISGAAERLPKRGSLRSLGGVLISAGILLISFVQYSVLTGTFPTAFVCLLVVVSIILNVFVYLFRAVLRLNSQEKVRKVNYLAFMSGATTPKPVLLIYFVWGICFLLLWPIVVLWMYFSSYPTQLEREVQMSIWHFCIPAIVSQLVFCVFHWHTLVSANVDEDLRNTLFLELFTLSLAQTIIVLYPAYLIGSSGTLSLISPGIWLLLSMPAFIFICGGVVPFLTGTVRHKDQLTNQVRWTRDWISQIRTNLHAASTEVTRSERDKLVNALEQRIRDKLDKNKLFSFLQNDLAAWRTQVSAGTPAQLTDQSVQNNTNAGEIRTSTALVGNDDTSQRSGILDDIRRARDAIRHTTPIVPPGQIQQQERLRTFVHEEGENLLEWDASFSHVDKLLAMRQEFEEFKRKRVNEQGLSAYLEIQDTALIRLDEEASAKQKKISLPVVLTAAISSGASALYGLIARIYEPQIVEFVGHVIRLN